MTTRRRAQTGSRGMTKDKTGAPTTVTAGPDRYTIAVEGNEVGHAEFLDRGDARVFTHTEVDKDLRRTRPGNDSHRRGAAGHPRCRAADRAKLPDGGQLRRQARRVPGHRRLVRPAIVFGDDES